ncbi:N-acyl-D-amino-acid deacylase [Pseudonocardia thermophila]|uniref:N-acyl-D-amino-acid deacylase n=1 Tax=Pseudonocardia thermophila TaxID=1848 RepID=A0A1M6WPB9_PSETH|nr:D-aminoacylase [Pseudonocardia thermophila]SHK95612.1 N-acyl-D-amino-acid deacylase [Pseudonocardia thermophila]
MNRILLRQGSIVDGTGTPPRPGSLLVEGDVLLDVLPPDAEVDAEVVDVAGLTLTPGFVDMHSHSDLHLLSSDLNEAKLLQGVTTEVIGQDGLSYAPVSAESLAHLADQLAGWNGRRPDLDWQWRSVADFLDRLDGSSVNVAFLVPHSTLRLLVVGSAARPATPEEIEQMCTLLDEALSQGAVGLSAGLTYAPGCYAETSELIALCSVVARHGGYYCPHHRNYGADVIGGYGECLDIAQESGVALHLAHTHLSFPANRNRLPELLDLLDSAPRRGIDLSFDAYPYLAGMSTLASQLPSWAREGSLRIQRARLRNADDRRRIVRALAEEGSDGHQGLPLDWDTIVVADVGTAAPWRWAVGRSLTEVAERLQSDPAEATLDLIADSDLAATCIMHFGIEEHVRALMQHPAHTVGSDGILEGARPHPRGWGSFARILGPYVRELGVLELPEAVRHMTSSATDRLGQRGRGRLLPGRRADIVAIDPAVISDRATYDRPRTPAVGVRHVLVNGRFAVRDGHVTGIRAGRVLTP